MLRLENGSTVAISPILKSKKDSDKVIDMNEYDLKAVAYKTLKIGLDTLCSKVVTVPEDYEEDTRMIEYCLNASGGQQGVEIPPKSNSSVPQGNADIVDEYGRLLRRTVTPETGQVMDSTRIANLLVFINRNNSTTIRISCCPQ